MREIDYREVAPPGQDSCQPGPDMTSAEGEAGRHSQWWGGGQGLASGGSTEGSLQHSRPYSALAAHFQAVVFLCLLVTHHCILRIIYQSELSAGPI